MRHNINVEIGFEIGFPLSVTFPCTRERDVTMATNFGTKLAINAFLRATTRIWFLLREFSS